MDEQTTRPRSLARACRRGAGLALIALAAHASADGEVVRVGVYDNAPKVFVDEQGRPAGFYVDLMDAIAERAGWTLRYVPCAWDACLAALEAGELELMVDVAQTPSRAQRFDFGAEVALSSWSVLYRAAGSGIESMIDLDGRRVAVLSDSVQQDALQSEAALYDIRPEVRAFSDFELAFEALRAGRVDAVLVNRFFGALHAYQYGAEETGVLLRPTVLKLATGKGRNAKLLRASDVELGALKRQPDSAYHAARARWLTPALETARLPVWVFWAAFAALLVIAALAAAVLTFRRLVERKSRELAVQMQHQRHLSRHDELTGLPNKRLLAERIEGAIEEAALAGSGVALFCIDVDLFKNVNDSFGHDTGDALLRALASRLNARSGARDLLGRLGADEFVLMLDGEHDSNTLAQRAHVLMDSLRAPFELQGETLVVSVSIGISRYPVDAADAHELLTHADTAMGRAKREGRNRFAFWAQELSDRAHARVQLESALHSAMLSQSFELHYQPQIGAGSGHVLGVEALLRWTHPLRGPISPARFLPVAEEMGLMDELGGWVLDRACAQAREWLDAGLEFNKVAVNVSGTQLRGRRLPGLVRRALEQHGLDASHLEIEITEGAFDTRSSRFVEQLLELRTLGVGVALDDFGTGYSSLGRLKHLPITTLKVDKSFVGGLPDDTGDVEIARAVVALGRALSLQVIAEGVGTEGQRDLLTRIGCDGLQGYLFCRPRAAEALAGFLRERSRLPALTTPQSAGEVALEDAPVDGTRHRRNHRH